MACVWVPCEAQGPRKVPTHLPYVVDSREAWRSPLRCARRLDGMPRNILTAVAWPYANGPRHIGHVSGFGVPPDVFSRYMRMAGHHVLMVRCPHEHGTRIHVQADAEGLTTRELAGRYN